MHHSAHEHKAATFITMMKRKRYKAREKEKIITGFVVNNG
jgi:hypothetical protein